MLAGFGLIAFGFVGWSLKVPKTEDMVIAGITVITMGARGQNGRGAGTVTATTAGTSEKQ